MEHVVFWAADGGPGEEFRRVADIDEAVREVERLRNEIGVDAAIFALTPVPVSFRTYYRVEVPGLDAPADAPVEVPSESVAQAPDEPADGSAELEAAALEEFAFQPDPAMDVPPLLPSAASVPQSRRDGDQEPSLGYFAR